MAFAPSTNTSPVTENVFPADSKLALFTVLFVESKLVTRLFRITVTRWSLYTSIRPFWAVNFASAGQIMHRKEAQQGPRPSVATRARAVGIIKCVSGRAAFIT